MFRALRPGQLVFDTVVQPVLYLLVAVPYLHVFGGNLLVMFGMGVSLVFWRLRPSVALALAWATSLIQMALGLQPELANVAIFLILFATAAYGSGPTKWLGLASTLVGAVAVTGYLVVGPQYEQAQRDVAILDAFPAISIVFLASLALFLLSWTLGFLSRTYGRARSSRQAQTAAESEKEQATRNAVVEQERTRIARDMHDVVAHSLAVVIAQADGARYAAAADPAAVDTALATISGTAREALGDVRILLGQLRHDEAPGPQPVLADLDRLVSQLRESGLRVEQEVEGEPGPLGTGAQLAVYRIAQEALTNALRHGDATDTTRFTLRWTADAVEVTVANRVAPGRIPTGGAGHGLVGMRERAVLAGGTFSVLGLGDDFAVTAVIPRIGRGTPEGGAS